MNWARILAFVTGMVDKELLARSEYLVAENRVLKVQLKGRLKLSDAERRSSVIRFRRPCGPPAPRPWR
jgi:putative transposase